MPNEHESYHQQFGEHDHSHEHNYTYSNSLWGEDNDSDNDHHKYHRPYVQPDSGNKKKSSGGLFSVSDDDNDERKQVNRNSPRFNDDSDMTLLKKEKDLGDEIKDIFKFYKKAFWTPTAKRNLSFAVGTVLLSVAVGFIPVVGPFLGASIFLGGIAAGIAANHFYKKSELSNSAVSNRPENTKPQEPQTKARTNEMDMEPVIVKQPQKSLESTTPVLIKEKASPETPLSQRRTALEAQNIVVPKRNYTPPARLSQGPQKNGLDRTMGNGIS